MFAFSVLPEKSTELKLLASIPTSSSSFYSSSSWLPLQRCWLEKAQGHLQKSHISGMPCSDNTLSGQVSSETESSQSRPVLSELKSCPLALHKTTPCSLAGLAGIPSKLVLGTGWVWLPVPSSWGATGKDSSRGLRKPADKTSLWGEFGCERLKEFGFVVVISSPQI